MPLFPYPFSQIETTAGEQEGLLGHIQPKTGTVVLESLKEAIGSSTTGSILSSQELDLAGKLGKPMTVEELKKLYPKTPWNKPHTKAQAEIIDRRGEEKREYQDLMSRASGWQNVGGTVAGIGASMLDPTDLALGLGIGKALSGVKTIANLTSRIAEAKLTGAGALGPKFKLGVVEGALGNVAAEPFIAYNKWQQYEEYGPMQSMANITFGALAGGLFRAAPEAARRAFPTWLGGKQTLTHVNALDTAVRQAAAGKDIEVSPIIMADNGNGTGPKIAGAPKPDGMPHIEDILTPDEIKYYQDSISRVPTLEESEYWDDLFRDRVDAWKTKADEAAAAKAETVRNMLKPSELLDSEELKAYKKFIDADKPEAESQYWADLLMNRKEIADAKRTKEAQDAEGRRQADAKGKAEAATKRDEEEVKTILKAKEDATKAEAASIEKSHAASYKLKEAQAKAADAEAKAAIAKAEAETAKLDAEQKAERAKDTERALTAEKEKLLLAKKRAKEAAQQAEIDGTASSKAAAEEAKAEEKAIEARVKAASEAHRIEKATASVTERAKILSQKAKQAEAASLSAEKKRVAAEKNARVKTEEATAAIEHAKMAAEAVKKAEVDDKSLKKKVSEKKAEAAKAKEASNAAWEKSKAASAKLKELKDAGKTGAELDDAVAKVAEAREAHAKLKEELAEADKALAKAQAELHAAEKAPEVADKAAKAKADAVKAKAEAEKAADESRQAEKASKDAALGLKEAVAKENEASKKYHEDVEAQKARAGEAKKAEAEAKKLAEDAEKLVAAAKSAAKTAENASNKAKILAEKKRLKEIDAQVKADRDQMVAEERLEDVLTENELRAYKKELAAGMTEEQELHWEDLLRRKREIASLKNERNEGISAEKARQAALQLDKDKAGMVALIRAEAAGEVLTPRQRAEIVAKITAHANNPHSSATNDVTVDITQDLDAPQQDFESAAINKALANGSEMPAVAKMKEDAAGDEKMLKLTIGERADQIIKEANEEFAAEVAHAKELKEMKERAVVCILGAMNG